MAGTQELPKRRLGRTEKQVTLVSLGGVGIGGKGDGDLYGGISDEQAIATVHKAIELGINFIDTSPLYQESERRIGLALEALPEEKRKGLVISTKVGDECPPYSNNGGHNAFSREGVIASVEHSLKQLKVVKCFDVVLVHDPTMAEIDQFFAPGGGAEGLAELQKRGVVKDIGLGCLEHDIHKAFLEKASSPGVLLTVNDYNLVRRYVAPTSWVDAASKDVGVMNAGAFYMGFLADPYNSYKLGFKKNLNLPEIVKLSCEMADWCKENGYELRTLALQFALDHPSVSTVPIGCRTSEEVEQVVESLLNPLPKEKYDEFLAKFNPVVAGLSRSAHFFYDKTTTKI